MKNVEFVGLSGTIKILITEKSVILPQTPALERGIQLELRRSYRAIISGTERTGGIR